MLQVGTSFAMFAKFCKELLNRANIKCAWIEWKVFFYWCKVEFRVISNLFLVLGVLNKERQLIDEKGINDGDIVIHFRSHE
jgi:hypothetical protein